MARKPLQGRGFRAALLKIITTARATRQAQCRALGPQLVACSGGICNPSLPWANALTLHLPVREGFAIPPGKGRGGICDPGMGRREGGGIPNPFLAPAGRSANPARTRGPNETCLFGRDLQSLPEGAEEGSVIPECAEDEEAGFQIPLLPLRAGLQIRPEPVGIRNH